MVALVEESWARKREAIVALLRIGVVGLMEAWWCCWEYLGDHGPWLRGEPVVAQRRSTLEQAYVEAGL